MAFDKNLAGKRILVVGAGKSGMAVARFCSRRGALVTVSDRRGASEIGSGGDLLNPAISWELGGHDEASFLAADLIVVSPGVPEIPALAAARKKSIPITGEIELAARFVRAPIIAITGTNGKSTTTAMAGEMAKKSGRPTFVGGNLGTPLISAVAKEGPETAEGGLCVVELSSYQLETAETLHPRAAALLNLTPDHLDRYPSVQAYGEAKLRIAQRMTTGDVLVVNADDDFFATRAAPLAAPHKKDGPRLLEWSMKSETEASNGRLWKGKLQIDVVGGVESYPLDGMQFVGRHNAANALAALLLLRGPMLCSPTQALAGLQAFKPLPHRMQLVGEKRGIRYYNDSKATNVDSVVAGLDGFPSPLVLIAGGRDKGGSYEPLLLALQHNTCRGIVLIGEAADRIAESLRSLTAPVVRATSMADAIGRATELAHVGDAVLLSPACSSFDMFDNYEQRGEIFAATVEELPT